MLVYLFTIKVGWLFLSFECIMLVYICVVYGKVLKISLNIIFVHPARYIEINLVLCRKYRSNMKGNNWYLQCVIIITHCINSMSHLMVNTSNLFTFVT